MILYERFQRQTQLKSRLIALTLKTLHWHTEECLLRGFGLYLHNGGGVRDQSGCPAHFFSLGCPEYAPNNLSQ